MLECYSLGRIPIPLAGEVPPFAQGDRSVWPWGKKRGGQLASKSTDFSAMLCVSSDVTTVTARCGGWFPNQAIKKKDTCCLRSTYRQWPFRKLLNVQGRSHFHTSDAHLLELRRSHWRENASRLDFADIVVLSARLGVVHLKGSSWPQCPSIHLLSIGFPSTEPKFIRNVTPISISNASLLFFLNMAPEHGLVERVIIWLWKPLSLVSIWTLSGVANYHQVLKTLGCKGETQYTSKPLDAWSQSTRVFSKSSQGGGCLKGNYTQKMCCKSSEHPFFRGWAYLVAHGSW